MFSCSLLCIKVWFVLKQGHVQFHSISMYCQCLIIHLLLNNTNKWILNLLLINFHNVCYFWGGGLRLGVGLIFCLTCGFYSNNLYKIGGGFHHLTAMLWTRTKSMFTRKNIQQSTVSLNFILSFMKDCLLRKLICSFIRKWNIKCASRWRTHIHEICRNVNWTLILFRSCYIYK